MVVATDAAMEGDWPEESSRRMAKDLVAPQQGRLCPVLGCLCLFSVFRATARTWCRGVGVEAGDPPVKRDEGTGHPGLCLIYIWTPALASASRPLLTE